MLFATAWLVTGFILLVASASYVGCRLTMGDLALIVLGPLVLIMLLIIVLADDAWCDRKRDQKERS